MRKLFGGELQLGVILFLVSIPIVGALGLLLLEMGVGWALMLMDPFRHPVLVLITLLYLGWGLIELRKAIRRDPRQGEDSWVEGDR